MATAFKEIAKAVRMKEFIIDDQNRETFGKILHYFINSDQAGTLGIDPNKGFMIFGNVGTGKSWVMESFQRFCSDFVPAFGNNFFLISAREIMNLYADKGMGGLSVFGYNRHDNNPMGKPNPINLCIDDIGSEELSVKHFGSSMNAVGNLIQDRYEIWSKFGYVTHLTTNLQPEDISKAYGDRVASRIKEMCNIINLTGEDRRRK